MQFRRTGQRRRRVLIDEMLSVPTGKTESRSARPRRVAGEAAAQPAAKSYSDAALAGRQPPVTCLIPKRRWTLAVLFLSGLCAIAGLEALYGRVFHGTTIDRVALTSLDVEARGSLAAWLSSLLLATGAGISVMVFSLRRHKTDDYRGRYRLWLWAAIAFLAGSVDATTGLHTALGRLLTDASGTPLFGDGTVWWILSVGLVLGLLGARLLVELSTCRVAAASIVFALVGYTAGAAIEMKLLLAGGQVLASMVQSTSLMSAHFVLVFSIGLYCRYVYLDAQGCLPARPVNWREQAPSAAVDEDEGSKTDRSAKNVRIDSPHENRRCTVEHVEAPSTPPEAQEATVREEAADLDVEPGHKLSKAERRRLRKQMRRQQQDQE